VLGLAWTLRDDYARVGFKLIPTGGGRIIGMHMVAATAALLPACVLPAFLGYTGALYLAGALTLTVAFLVVAALAARDLTTEAARRIFRTSLLYHPLLLCLMLVDTVRI
jgi:protoheme IX farnesyltransferase